MRSVIQGWIAVAAVGALAGTAAADTTYQASAYSLFEETNTARDRLSDGRTVVTLNSRGTFVTDDPQVPLNHSRYTCYGTFVVSADGEETNGHGYCSGIDPTEDIWWVRWSGEITGGTWTFVSGTGKYRDARGGGSWLEADAGYGRDVNAWEGEITFPD